MKNRIIVGACVLVVGLLIFSSMPANFNTRAAPAVPHNAWGIAYDETAAAMGDMELITSWVDGVRYNFGDNFTFGGIGSYDVDTMGNNTLDETPGVKEGGYYNEPIMYLHGDGTSGSGSTIFEEALMWDSAVSDNVDLNEADMTAFLTFEWLVINNITADSVTLGGIDYVQIYNPNPAASVNIFNYHFEKNDGQPVPSSPSYNITFESLMPNPTLNLIPNQGRIWVNLTALSLDIDRNGDELKLVWDNTPGVGAPFGGYDVVVDRVEWGNQDMEPDNTTMLDAAIPGVAQELRRAVEGQDTNDCLVDFIADFEFAWVPYIPDQVVVTATHDAGAPSDVRLNWTAITTPDVAYGYMVYVNDITNPFYTIIGGSVTEWVNISGYDSLVDYTYVVTSWGPGGENKFFDNNIAYKVGVQLWDFPSKNGDVNYLALPCYMNLTVGLEYNTKQALADDIGAGTSVSRWDPSIGAWDSSNFMLACGEAYRVATIPGPMIYQAVGAHRNVSMTFINNLLIEGGVLNYVSLPYHMIMYAGWDNASYLYDMLNMGGSPMNQITRIARWDGLTSMWQSKTKIGIDFPLMAGVGYLVVTDDSTVVFGP